MTTTTATHPGCASALAYKMNRLLTNSGMPGLFKLKDNGDDNGSLEMVMRGVKVRCEIHPEGLITEVYEMPDARPTRSTYNCWNVADIWQSILKINVNEHAEHASIKRVQTEGQRLPKLVYSDQTTEKPKPSSHIIGVAAAMAVMIATNDLSKGY